eukprot:jgi/Chlat1/9158/Chrsp97S08398
MSLFMAGSVCLIDGMLAGSCALRAPPAPANRLRRRRRRQKGLLLPQQLAANDGLQYIWRGARPVIAERRSDLPMPADSERWSKVASTSESVFSTHASRMAHEHSSKTVPTTRKRYVDCRAATLAAVLEKPEETVVSLRRSPSPLLPSSGVEVHLRRVEGGDGDSSSLTRRMVAAVAIDAPSSEVWSAMKREVAAAKAKRPEVTLGPFRCVMEVLRMEVSGREVRFRQVQGEFRSLHGKWSLEPSPIDPCSTVLKCAVEVVLPNMPDPDVVLERVVYEVLPKRMRAIRDRLEASLAAGTSLSPAPVQVSVLPQTAPMATRRRRRRTVVTRGIDELVSELRKVAAGQGRPDRMPLRAELRAAQRVDLEKRIAIHGGFQAVADIAGLQMSYARKPAGYWDDLANIRCELHEFITQTGSEPGLMPTRNALIKAGRYDLARAYERWGGLRELAAMLKMRVHRPPSRLQVSQARRALKASEALIAASHAARSKILISG